MGLERIFRSLTMDENNDPELTDEDLQKLPFDKLLEMSQTSNHIRNRIQSPEFAKRHMRESVESETNRCLLLSTDPKIFLSVPVADGDSGDFFPKRKLVPPFFPAGPARKTEIVGHSAGLVCLASHGFPFSHLAIWNPSLSRQVYVQPFNWVEYYPAVPPETQRRMMIRDRPSYGFGFNPDTESHEILHLCTIEEPRVGIESREVRIYGLATRSWEQLADLDKDRYGHFEITTFSGSPFVENHMHWAMQRGQEGEDEVDREFRVLAFGVTDRQFRDFAGPRSGRMFQGKPRVWMLGETLCFIELKADGQVGVWKMREYGNELSWTMTYNVRTTYDFDRFESAFPLMEIKAHAATLFLGNHNRTAQHYQGACYVQSFLLGDELVTATQIPMLFP